MTVSTAAGRQIRLSGVAGPEDAEPLVQLLLDLPDAAVDWSRCQACHTAVLQVLLATGRTMIGTPDNAFLKAWIAPTLKTDHG